MTNATNLTNPTDPISPTTLPSTGTSSFSKRLRAAQDHTHSALAIGLAPRLDKMPLPMQKHDDSFLPFGKAIIDATCDVACAYIFDLAAYLALGAAGAIALERTLAYVPSPLIKILHGPFATADYVRAVSDGAFAADAVTLSASSKDVLAPYLSQGGRGVFVNGTHGLQVAPFTVLDAAYPGQIGVYTLGSRPHTLGLLDTACAEMRWYADEIAYASAGEDFGTAAHEAAVKYKSPA